MSAKTARCPKAVGKKRRSEKPARQDAKAGSNGINGSTTENKEDTAGIGEHLLGLLQKLTILLPRLKPAWRFRLT